MRTLLLASFAVLISLNTWAQSDSSYFEVGVNAFRLIGVPKATPAHLLNPYLLHAEFGNGKIGARFGLGMNFRSETEQPNATNGNSSFSDDTTSLDLRVGLVLAKNLSPRWSFKYGLDLFISSARRSYTSVVRDVDGLLVESTTESSRSETGGGLFVFPQFHITKRVSIATELNLLYASTLSEGSTTSSDFPEFNTVVSKEGSYFSLRPPTALFLIIRF